MPAAELRMAAPGFFPLLVEGSWGPYPPKNLSTKLQVYFQSQKRSGGGECEVRQEPGNPVRFLVLFHSQDGEGRLGRVRAGTAGLSPPEKLGTGARSGRMRLALAAAVGSCKMGHGCAGWGSLQFLCPALAGAPRCCPEVTAEPLEVRNRTHLVLQGGAVY